MSVGAVIWGLPRGLPATGDDTADLWGVVADSDTTSAATVDASASSVAPSISSTCYVLSCLRRLPATANANNIRLPAGVSRVGIVVPAPVPSPTAADARRVSSDHGGVSIVAFYQQDGTAAPAATVTVEGTAARHVIFVSRRCNSDGQAEWTTFTPPSKIDPTALLPLVFLRCQVTYTLPILCPPRSTPDELAACIRAEAVDAVQASQQEDVVMLSSNGEILSGLEDCVTLGSLLDTPQQREAVWASSSTYSDGSGGGSKGGRNTPHDAGNNSRAKGSKSKNKKGKGKGKGKGKNKGKGGKKKPLQPMLQCPDSEEDENDDNKNTLTASAKTDAADNAAPPETIAGPGSSTTISVEIVVHQKEQTTRDDAARARVQASTPSTNSMCLCPRQLSVDVVAVVSRVAAAAAAANLVLSSVREQLTLLSEELVRVTRQSGGDRSASADGVVTSLPKAHPEMLVFSPDMLGHPIAGVSVQGCSLDDDDDMANDTSGTDSFQSSNATPYKRRIARESATRRALSHHIYQDFWDQCRPTLRFRPTCAWGHEIQADNPRDAAKLLSVHFHCPHPKGAGMNPSDGMTLHMVHGAYRYYHYMQDNFDDKGWGCAYRSLQTLWSWFELNHYTRRPPPTHSQIQQTLVDIGDKPAHFIGSKDWIGSQGVGWCLNQHLGVDSKYLFVPSGAQLPEKARELSNHFDTQGTPVMMGGGALAFTILGVAWNKKTGAAQFLILDPHYVGKDDATAVCTKEVRLEGYRAVPCGWRDAAGFRAGSFYNCCLPQVAPGVV